MATTDEQKELLMQLGKKIREIRQMKSLTLKEVAHSIEKDTQSIHRLEKGGVNPTYLYLLQLCKGLNIELSDLLESKNE